MRQFPIIAQVYVWLVTTFGGIVGAIILVGWLRSGGPSHPAAVLTAICGSAAAVGMSYLKVPIPITRRRESATSSAVSLGYVPTLFLLFWLGTFESAVAGALSALAMTCHPRRSAYYQILFSVAGMILAVTSGALVLQVFGITPESWRGHGLLPMGNSSDATIHVFGALIATAAHALVNTLLVAGAIGFTTRKNPLRVWRDKYLWMMPSYLAGGACVALVLMLLPYISRNVWAVLPPSLVAMPMVYLIFLAYRHHRDGNESNARHIEELERKNLELENSRAAVGESKEALERLYTSTVESLALAIDAKDRYTKEHIQRVKDMAVLIAIRLGLTGDDMKAIETGALLHDIGKLAIPEHILSKPGRLTDEEFEKIKSHPELGARILEPVPFPFPVLPIVRGHHERWDGKGYPDGLSGEDIPLGARVLAVADVYDALTSDRSYRAGWSSERAIAQIQAGSGSHFDPIVVVAFLAVMAEYEPQPATAPTPITSAPTPAPVSNVRDEINRASFEYLSLYEISQAASATLDPAETLSLLANKLRLLFGASACVLLLAEDRDAGVPIDSPSVLRAAAASGRAEATFASAMARIGGTGRAIGITERVARSRRGGAVDRYDQADLVFDRPLPANDAADLAEMKTALVVPLTAGEDAPLLGTINLYHARADAFTPEDVRVLETVSAHVARAIRNVHEFDRTRRSAMTDSLTGLYNTRHLAQFLDRELLRANAEGRPLTVMVLDVDGFKQVNDRFGHARGNEVLRDLGITFQSVLRNGDLVARYAGDEYVVVVPGVGPETAPSVAEKIRAAVARYDGRPLGTVSATDGGSGAVDADLLGGVRIGISIGTASFPQDATDAAALIARADRAMYHDKDARRAAEEQAVRQMLADAYPE